MENNLMDAPLISVPEIDICFVIHDSFNLGSQASDARDQSNPLPPIDIERKVPSLLRSQDAEGHEEALHNYYSAVLQAADKHGTLLDDIGRYFWLRLWIWNSEADFHVRFPWYDELNEMRALLLKLVSNETGHVYSDADQDWEIDIQADDNFIYIREGSEDFQDVRALAKFERRPFAIACASVLQRAQKIIDGLGEKLGKDFWSQRPFSNPFVHIVLNDCGPNKVGLIKELRLLVNNDVSIAEITSLVNESGKLLLIQRRDSDDVKKKLEASGADVSIQEMDEDEPRPSFSFLSYKDSEGRSAIDTSFLKLASSSKS